MRKPLLLICFYWIYIEACTPTPTESLHRESSAPDSLERNTMKDFLIDSLMEDIHVPPIDYDTSEWTELTHMEGKPQLDIKYASTNNFVQEKMYECGRCFLRPEVAQAVIKAQWLLQTQNYGLLLLDCFRPHSIQWKLWEKMPDPRYVTDPRKGSMHNRGMAIDLTLTDRQGRSLDMGTPFDYFGQEAYHTYTELPDSILERRQLLKNTMEALGFRSIRTEWWHYSYQGKFYPLSNMLWKCYE